MNGVDIIGRPRRLAARLGIVLALCLTAMYAANGGAQTTRADDTTCAQWEVSGTWGLIDADYSYTAAFSQEGTILRGGVTLAEGDWQTAGWTGPTMDLRGSVTGNLLDFTITISRPNGTSSFPRFTGTIVRGTIDPTYGEVTDGIQTVRGASASWTGTGPANCAPTATPTPAVGATPTPSLAVGVTPGPSLTLVKIGGDPEAALREAFGGYYGSADLTVLNKVDNPDDASEVADDLLDGFDFQVSNEALYTNANEQTVRDLYWMLGYLSAAEDAYGLPLVPVLHSAAIVEVISKMAYHAATEKDPDQAEQWLTATQRLLALLTSSSVEAQPSQAPLP